MARRTRVDAVAANAGWEARVIQAARFDLRAFSRPGVSGDELTIYLEGDGVAFIGRDFVSADPTPTDPVVLQMALADPGPSAYLARPCQYIWAARSRCGPVDWTDARYGPDIVLAMDQAVTALVAQARARRVILVGYSGGGALAVLLAARRTDIAGVVTIAANLDLADWTARNGFAPMLQSLNPADQAQAVADLPQVHFAGARDEVVQPAVAQSFLARISHAAHATLIVVPDYNHLCCWARDWPVLRRRAIEAGIKGWGP